MADTPFDNDHDLLIRIDEKMRLLTIEIQSMTKQYDGRLSALENDKLNVNTANKIHDDHEKRIRRLEIAYVVGLTLLGVLQFVAPFIISTIQANV